MERKKCLVASNCRSDDAVTNDRETTSFVSRDKTLVLPRGADAGRLKYLEEKSLPRFDDKFFFRSSLVARFRELAPDLILNLTKDIFRLLPSQRTILIARVTRERLSSIAVTDTRAYEVLISREKEIFHIFSNMLIIN